LLANIKTFEFRKLKKDNWPVTEILNIPMHKKGKLLGPGGINLKRIMLETGAQVINTINYYYKLSVLW